jgi:hypothetical protein
MQACIVKHATRELKHVLVQTACTASILKKISFLKEIWTSWRKYLLGNSNMKEIWEDWKNISKKS